MPQSHSPHICEALGGKNRDENIVVSLSCITSLQNFCDIFSLLSSLCHL